MNLISCLERARSPFHTVEAIRENLLSAGFRELFLESPFGLEAGRSYFVCPSPTSLFAFVVPQGFDAARLSSAGFAIAAAHTDFPTFRVKPCPDLDKKNAGRLIGINVEPYGGMLKRTWFDRPLGLAGAVYLCGTDENPAPRQVIYASEKPLFLIPSLAPHMDRAIESKEIDVQKEIVPLFPLPPQEDDAVGFSFLALLASELGVKPEEILTFDLSLFCTGGPVVIGGGETGWLTAQGIDNTASAALLTQALVAALQTSGASEAPLPLIALFDSEEIGSRTRSGADSNLLTWVLERIFESALFEGTDTKSALLRSVLLSVDGAHAIHPNFPEKTDPSTVVQIGQGFVIKSSASQRYATDARVTAQILSLCRRLGVKVQRQANRSGSPGGQTLGPIAVSYLPVPAADIGLPMLAMHSIRETASLADCDALGRFLTAFFERGLN